MTINDLKKFGNIAKELSHNPLGIIALAFVFVYGVAAITLSFGGNFSEVEHLIVILFLVLFPVIILLVFYLLVSKHHDKLYSPSDFRDETHFVKLIETNIKNSPQINHLEELTAKIQKEIDNQPLYCYTKLTESGKVLVLIIFKESSLNLDDYTKQRGFDGKEVVEQAKTIKEYGWISISNNIITITSYGVNCIGTFQDICYARLK
jgi:hypothetical protein